MPQVGTTAASVFTWNLIKNKNVIDAEAMEMLAKLPFNHKDPSEKLLNLLEPMIKESESLSQPVRKSCILAFSTLVYRTFSKVSVNEDNETLNKYLNFFYDRLLSKFTSDYLNLNSLH